jgi:hypothetical protein
MPLNMAGVPKVLVEVVDLNNVGSRQIGAEDRATELLRSRAPDIKGAISEASEIARDSLATVAEGRDWRVHSLTMTFGLTLTAEAGIVVTKASAGASFSVTLTVEHSQEA